MNNSIITQWHYRVIFTRVHTVIGKKIIYTNSAHCSKTQPFRYRRASLAAGLFSNMISSFLVIRLYFGGKSFIFRGFFIVHSRADAQTRTRASFSLWAVWTPPPALGSDLHSVHSGRRQLVVARCHAKLWPLSVQSHRRAGEAKVKRTGTGAAQYVVLGRDLMLQIFQKSGERGGSGRYQGLLLNV